MKRYEVLSNLTLAVGSLQISIQLIPKAVSRAISGIVHAHHSAAGNGESRLGPVFGPFSNSHQYRFQIGLRQLDISAFSGQNKVTISIDPYL